MRALNKRHLNAAFGKPQGLALREIKKISNVGQGLVPCRI